MLFRSNFMYSYDASTPLDSDFAWNYEKAAGRGPDDLIPGTYKLKANMANNYNVDRETQKSLARIEAICGVPVDIISTGPDRDETIVRRHPFKG